MIIAIDGPSGSGKTTTAKLLAERLKIMHLDTGAMYRAVTWGLLNEKINLEQSKRLNSFLNEMDILFNESNDIFLNKKNISLMIRTKDITSKVSLVSSISEVRSALVKIQRDMSKNLDFVIEGRDIGTVVFPNADFKFYLTADINIRARRRKSDLKNIGEDFTVDEIKKQIEIRDLKDSTRENSPLKKAIDAIVIDTSILTVNEQIEKIINIIKNNK
tara:strand:- start:812 stop:1462 length:651 start_codon:yes stop_codon:yes gene_type:complete